VAIDTLVQSGGTLLVRSGGAARRTTMNASGYQVVDKGGLAVGTKMGAATEMLSGGTASGTTINGKGYQVVKVGGRAVDTRIANLGQQKVFSGGVAINTTLNDSVEFVHSGAKTTGSTAPRSPIQSQAPALRC